MLKISINEKAWDAVRPSSVTKTGLSEVIRSSTKALAASLTTPKAYDDAQVAIDKLRKAIEQAAAAVKKASDDKKGAAAKLKQWVDECDVATRDLKAQRQQAGVLLALTEVESVLKDTLHRVEEATKDAGAMVAELKSGKLTDTKAATQRLQGFRNAARDGLKVSQKDGFAEFIRTFKQVQAWGLDSTVVPMSPTAKALKDKVALLLAAAEKAREETETLVAKAGAQHVGNGADVAKPLLKVYAEMQKNIKAMLAPMKSANAKAHELADKFKQLSAKGAPADKLLALAEDMHKAAMKIDVKATTEIARGRVSSGDAQGLRIKLRDGLKNDKTAYEQFEKIASEQWNLVMVTYREVSEQMSQVHLQVDRVVRLIGESSPAAKQPAMALAKRMAEEYQDHISQFTK